MRTEGDLRATGVTRRSSRRGVRLSIGVVLGVAVIVLVTVVVSRGAGRSVPAAASPSPGTGGSPATAVPGNLADVGWEAISVQGVGASAQLPMSGLILRTNGNFQAGLDRCTDLLGTARFDGGTAEFHSAVSNHSCPPDVKPSSNAQNDLTRERLIESILTGTVEWNVHQDELRITKKGIGTITYVRGPSNPPSPDGAA